jgi:hypothetical protein
MMTRPHTTSDRPFLGAATHLFSWLLLAGALVTMVAAIRITVAAYCRIPEADLWVMPVQVSSRVPLPYWLWSQHNEHRILIPRLILLADYHFFHGRDIFPRVLTLVLLALEWLALLFALRRLGGLRGDAWRTACAMTGLAVFCTSQWYNFSSGLQVAFVLVPFAVVWSLVCMLLYRRAAEKQERRAWLYIALASLAAACATYSLANGILIWPVLVLMAAWMRFPKPATAWLLAAGALVAASYLYHYHSPTYHSNPLKVIRAPAAVAKYSFIYLSSPFHWAGQFAHPVATGMVGVVLAIAVVAVTVLKWRQQPVAMLFVALLVFDAGSAVITSLGRMTFGPNQALSGRYETFALGFWMCIGMLMLLRIAQNRAALLALQVLLLSVMGIAGFRLRVPMRDARNRALFCNTVSFAILTHVYDPDQLRGDYHDPELLWKLLPALQNNGLSVFATQMAHDLNRPLDAAYRLRPQRCFGSVERVLPVQTQAPGSRVSGWAWDARSRKVPSQIILVSGERIVGYAQPGYWRPELAKHVHDKRARRAGWIGYAEPLDANSSLRAYGKVGNSVCQFFPPAQPPAPPGR